ncbi:FGFR1 oncoprotein partner 2 [Halocaridina rubra]|uniref:FGFR1 oncoprotein partner 2 n=1 Tax=Halocaridina rubra TaxID=373956 RepID=A0AAN9A6B8_HALRR
MKGGGSSIESLQSVQVSSPSSSASDMADVAPSPQMHRLPRTKRKHTVVFKYCEEMNELNEAANNRPRSALIHSIQQENRHIRQLQQENKELRLALEEHQNVMELIMSKYRQQVAKLVSVNSKQSQPNTQEHTKLAAQIEQISEMVAVMRKAAALGDDESNYQEKVITALVTENKGLKEMLNIAYSSGSIVPSSRLVDAETQTEQETEQELTPMESNSVTQEMMPVVNTCDNNTNSKERSSAS